MSEHTFSNEINNSVFIEEFMNNGTDIVSEYAYDIPFSDHEILSHMEDFEVQYRSVHGYLSLILCVFGILSNAVVIMVLTRKDMISSINILLISIAVADIIIVLLYLPFSILYIQGNFNKVSHNTYTTFILRIAQVFVILAFDSIATWLTIVVGIWRCIAVQYPLKAITWCSVNRAIIVIVATSVSCLLFFVPQHFLFVVGEVYTGVYVFEIKKTISPETVSKIMLWTYGFVNKVVPSIILIIVTVALIRCLKISKSRRLQLQESNDKNKGETDRTTGLLLVVLIFYLIMELPGGLILTAQVILQNNVMMKIHGIFTDLMDLCSLINKVMNLVIYITMSTKFRQRMTSIISCMPLRKRQQSIESVSSRL